MQALKYSSLPIEGTGPYKFLIDDYNVISDINFYQKRIENNHQSTIKYSHIYSHLNKKPKEIIYFVPKEKILFKCTYKEPQLEISTKRATKKLTSNTLSEIHSSYR